MKILHCPARILLACFLTATLIQAATTQPNIVIIYGDDVGIGDVGVYGSKLIPTPNIDQLAAQGIRFTDGHSTASTCSPSRFSLLTGVHDFRHNIGILSPISPLCIPTDRLTLPKMLQRAGYATGVIGKWHLGLGKKGADVDWNGEVRPGPLEVGFDKSFVIPITNDRVPCVYLDDHRVLNLDTNDPVYVSSRSPIKPSPKTARSTVYPDGKVNPEAMTYYKAVAGHSCTVINGIGRIGYMVGGKSALWNDEDMADVLMDRTKQFIKANKDRPFFLYFSSQDIHVPRAPHPRFQGKTTLSHRGDAMVQLDWSTGEILKTLAELGLAENTIVIFSSDNGPVYNDGYYDGTTVKGSQGEVDRGHDGSGMYSGGKYQIFEGGTRVPFIIRWPGKIKAGAVSDALVSQIDLMASFAKLLGVNLAQDEGPDSRDMLATFTGDSTQGLDYLIEFANQGQLAIRHGSWKYLIPSTRDGPIKEARLFNLENDPGEKKNLIDQQPEIAATLAKKFTELSQDGARLRP